MRIETSERVRQIPRSGIRAMASRAQGREGLIHLEFGEPSFPTPAAIREAAAAAVRSERMTYTPTEGPLSLRVALADKIRRVNGYEVTPEEIFVTHGGVGALFLALAAVVGPGDAVMLPDPGWPNTLGQVITLGGVPHPYPLHPETGYLPDPDSWQAPPNLKAVVVNSPANPTGAIFPEATLAAIAAFARRHGAVVIADEVYDQIAFDERPVSMRRVLPEATLAVYSFSKTYAMTGWRLGYLVAPKPLLDEVRKVAESVFSSTSMPAQRAAEAALAVTAAEIQAMVDAYRARRDLALDLLRAWGRYRYTPKGAFYLMVDVPRSLGAEAAALRLLEEHGVVTVPGTAFGQNAAQALRISLAADEDAIRAGLTAIRDLG